MSGGQLQPPALIQVPPFWHGLGSQPYIDMQWVKMENSFMRIWMIDCVVNNMLSNFNSDLILSSEMDLLLQISHVFPLQWMGQEHSPSWQVPPFLHGLGLHALGTAKKIRWFMIDISKTYISKNNVHNTDVDVLYQ